MALACGYHAHRTILNIEANPTARLREAAHLSPESSTHISRVASACGYHVHTTNLNEANPTARLREAAHRYLESSAQISRLALACGYHAHTTNLNDAIQPHAYARRLIFRYSIVPNYARMRQRRL